MHTPPAPLDPQVLATLQGVSTATIGTVLPKKGLRNVWMRGSKPLRAGLPRSVGRAFTLRFVPAREDLSTPAAWSSPRSTRAAVEQMPAGSIVAAAAMGCTTDAGSFGDILCARLRRHGVAALLTDGVVRDLAGVDAGGLPVRGRGRSTAAPAAVTSLHFAGWQEPVGCGGVAVFPGDVVVADDGAVLVPDHCLADVLAAGVEQERLEAWILGQVVQGAGVPGLYPPDAAAPARYRAGRAATTPEETT